MPYNIDSIDYISGHLTITAGAAAELLDDLCLPEGTFLEDSDCWHAGESGMPTRDVCNLAPDEVLTIYKPWFYGDGSGGAYEDLRDAVLPRTKGKADLLIVWEGGDSITGLRVRDGKVTECDVEHKLIVKGQKAARGVSFPQITGDPSDGMTWFQAAGKLLVSLSVATIEFEFAVANRHSFHARQIVFRDRGGYQIEGAVVEKIKKNMPALFASDFPGRLLQVASLRHDRPGSVEQYFSSHYDNVQKGAQARVYWMLTAKPDDYLQFETLYSPPPVAIS